MSKWNRWELFIPLILFVILVVISINTGYSSNQKTGNSKQVQSSPVNELNSSYVKFTRFARSDTWQKNKRQWLSLEELLHIDKSHLETLLQTLYDQNYFIPIGASQGSKILYAVGMEDFEPVSSGNYPPLDSVPILTLYSNVKSINVAKNDIIVTIEPKSAGYDSIYIPRTEMSSLPHTNAEGSETYNFVFAISSGDILHKEKIFL